ncbi:Mss4-like protein [Sistotremastrum niveocremeum HHB9708]|uniref:Mss4-like protein n=1 Tax=Sistotremastrum niveocremeum HHB9708 TaxID=1314777 RepID=A0A164UPK4_9AGAM|nr:Mss4-like protein [Sistotremastrum niveocremeum HHB9708]
MSTNDPTGRSVCIHAVAVSPPFRKRGVASALMRNYVERMQTEPDVDRLLLICHDDLVQFYEQCGFKYVGKSHVVHGARAWFEMCLEISTSTAPQSISPEVFAALKKPAPQHPQRYLDSFSSLSAVRDSSGLNAHDLICPRVGCGSIILKCGVADLAIPSPEPQLPPELPRLPDPWTGLNANHEEWWLITPSPMSFENVSFSKPTQSQGGSSTPIKYLGCAECDLGPLGWCKATGGEFWLAPSRVGYKV